MNIFGGLAGLGSVASVQLEWRTRDGSAPQTVTLRGRGAETETLPLFTNKDSIVGDVKATPIPGKKADHLGIRVQLIGQIELASERGHPTDFLSLARELAPAGDLRQQAVLPFEFKSVEMEHDSYKGLQVRLRYLLRVTISRNYGASVVRDFPFWVRNYQPVDPSPSLAPVKMEVGIEDCLHIEFEYMRGRYHLQDTVVGKIYFLLVRIRLKHMEIEIRRREYTGSGKSERTELETLAKFEIMDGAPVRGENIPIRMYLAPYDMTPTYRAVHNKFSVRYSLNLVLVDQEDRRYFKQQEIELFRAPPQTSAGRAPALHRGTAAAPSAEAEAEAAAAVGPGSAPSHRPGAQPPVSSETQQPRSFPSPASPSPAPLAVPAPAAAAPAPASPLAAPVLSQPHGAASPAPAAAPAAAPTATTATASAAPASAPAAEPSAASGEQPPSQPLPSPPPQQSSATEAPVPSPAASPAESGAPAATEAVPVPETAPAAAAGDDAVEAEESRPPAADPAAQLAEDSTS
eukprot:CAMPEP_0206152146 /NCGR_PEP_ID=MMETSP1473-20131121/39179_1 /ASSEMBLY_ACC=CAM_ASM_001109 /TAXON_ID=1461547 /ORGANISM="Stichococcus sp, Strain RCC1054" /LENGTH=516 /DNA_ID=CAMNT_0053549703 /DNA_START=223 /DNA_END=1773 /DNA_ORIENTATION=-